MRRYEGHRKRIKHFHRPGDCHELTFSCYQRMPLLTNDTWREMLSVSIGRAIERHRFALVAFVYMPEHVHLLVYPRQNDYSISALLKGLKQPFSNCVRMMLEEEGSALLGKLTVRERPGKMAFRFWQEGPGYDRNLDNPRTVRHSIDYIHNNPVARGLVTQTVDWRWSSYRYYVGGELARDESLPVIHGLPAEYLDEGGVTDR